jgi:glucosamine--fructose-6-phosphate aminotransferase (isomerizing)
MSQSGETADTLACVEKAATTGSPIVAFCNRVGASIPQLATQTFYLGCGPEVSVAATKTFTSMVLCSYLFALGVGAEKKFLSEEALTRKLLETNSLPAQLREALKSEQQISVIAKKHATSPSALFVGRRWNFPAALEGALKLKEVSYIHAEGLAGGELKHGTLALVDKDRPIFAIAPKDAQHPKMLSNVREIGARNGRIIGFGDKHDSEFQRQCENYVTLPSVPDCLSPIISSVALQLLAYHVATFRGVEIDRPRNLAKSVTVE